MRKPLMGLWWMALIRTHAHRRGPVFNQAEKRGRHADLLAQDGMYAAMWWRQQEAAARTLESPDASPPKAIEAAK